MHRTHTHSNLAGRRGGPSRRLGGFTLVEVVIALVIFLFGALAIVRIFPPGLGVIQNSGEQLTATNLNRATLAKFQTQPKLVPDAIYDIDPTTSQWNDFNGAVVGTRNRNNALPVGTSVLTATSETAFSNSSLGHFGRIVGEHRRVQLAAVPVETPTGTEPFVLTQYPYKDSSAQAYIEDEVNNVTIDKNGVLDFSQATLASTGNAFSGPMTFPNRPPTTHRSSDPAITTAPNSITYYVSYRWTQNIVIAGVTTTHLNGVVDEPKYLVADPVLPATDNYDAQMLAGKMTRSKGKIAPGLVSVRFRKKLTPVAASIAADQERGYLPLLASEVTAGQMVSIDYTVRDWRFIVDDNGLSQIPSTSPTPPTSFPTTTFSPLAVTLPVKGLVDQVAPVTSLLMAPIVDDATKNGQIRLLRAQWSAAGAPTGLQANSLLDVSAKSSQITYNAATPTASFVTPRVRTVYRTLDQWAQQLSVAANSYVPFPGDIITGSLHLDSNLVKNENVNTPNERPEPWREYIPANSSLYFHPSEAGKAIQVTYEFPSGAAYKTVTKILSIEDKILENAPAVDPRFATLIGGKRYVVEARLTDDAGNIITPTAILSVKGVSVMARTAWLNYDHYNQIVTSGYRQ